MPDDQRNTTQEDLADQAAAASTEVAAGEPKQEFVSKAEYDTLTGRLDAMTVSLEAAGKRLAVIDQVATMLTGRKEADQTPEEKAVVTELRRILPELQHLHRIPKMADVVEQASKTASETLVTAAYAYQLELQQAANVKVDDPKLNTYVAAGIKEWMNQDTSRQARFWRGDRSVIKEGFEEVKAAVIDPLRSGDRRAVAALVGTRPRNAAPAGGAGAGSGERGLDFADRKAVRAAFKDALG